MFVNWKYLNLYFSDIRSSEHGVKKWFTNYEILKLQIHVISTIINNNNYLNNACCGKYDVKIISAINQK